MGRGSSSSKAEKPEKLDRRVVRTRKAIRESFRKLIIDKDISKITVSALAREADIDRKTFYLHYSSIDDLIEQEVASIIEQIANTLSLPSDSGSNETPFAKLKRILIELARVVEKDEKLYQRVFSSVPHDQLVDFLYEPVYQSTFSNLGEKSCLEASTLGYIVRFYVSGILSMFRQWLKEGRKQPIESIVETFEQALVDENFTVLDHPAPAIAPTGA